MARGDGHVPGRPALARRRGRRALAPPDPAPPARAPRRAGPRRLRGDRARVHRLSRHLRGGVDQGLPRAGSGQSLQRRLLHARHARVEPLIRRIRNAMSGAGCASRTPRASATSASTRSTSATGPRCSAADEHAVYKNGAKEIAAQEGMAITFMAKYDEREGNSCHIHLSLRGTDGDPSSRATTRCSALRRRPARLPARADAALRARTSTPTSASPRAPSRRPRWRGAGQPHLRAARDRATAPAAAWRTACPAPTSTPILALAAMIAAGLHGIEPRAELDAARYGQPPTRPTSRACRHTLRDAHDAFTPAARSLARPFARGRRALRQQRARGAGGLRVGRTDWERVAGLRAGSDPDSG
jgi:glutamine synthetase